MTDPSEIGQKTRFGDMEELFPGFSERPYLDMIRAHSIYYVYLFSSYLHSERDMCPGLIVFTAETRKAPSRQSLYINLKCYIVSTNAYWLCVICAKKNICSKVHDPHRIATIDPTVLNENSILSR